MTPLDKTLKRSLKINRIDYVVALTPDSLKLTQKGHRLGLSLTWADLVSGETALAVALHASIGRFQATDSPASVTPQPKTKQKPTDSKRPAPKPKRSNQTSRRPKRRTTR